jgi:thiosulfate/3-mercaptopyruvate sulfurtransferase
VLWNVYADLKDEAYQPVSAAAFRRLVEHSGITPQSTVIFYGYAPALALWLMKLYGHRDVRILNCSRETWARRGGPLTTYPSMPPVATYMLPPEDRRIRASLTDVMSAIQHPLCAIADVRSVPEFQGECFWPSGGDQPDGRAGHVPLAQHVPVTDLRDESGAFLDLAELREVFAGLAIPSTGEVITYCTIGGRAATAWFALTYLMGHDNVRVYDGSWAQWGRTPTTPVARATQLAPQLP